MALIESFTTAGLAPLRRRYFWEEVISRVFIPLNSKPAFPSEFNAQLRCTQLGSLSLARASSSPASVIHNFTSARHTH
jgi:hypothetical protein